MITQPDTIDDLTKKNIAQALWMEKYDESKIPADILKKIKRKCEYRRLPIGRGRA